MTVQHGERIQGIDHPLPPGERVRWQGSPSIGLLAAHAFHVRAVLIYFIVIVGIWSVRYVGEIPRTQLVTMFLAQAAMAGLVVMGVFVLSWAVSASSVYAITDRRVVIKTGIAFPMTINVPLKVIESAALKRYRDGTGEIAMTLDGSDRVAFLALWPHARPWHFKVPQPSLRALAHPDDVGKILQQAVQEFAEREGLPVPASNGNEAETRAAVLAHDAAVA